MEEERTLERDWSSLPLELLNLIAKNLSEILDFVRFRAVCTAWRFCISVSDLPQQFPLILETWRKHNETNLRFYSSPSSKSSENSPGEVTEHSKGYMLAKLYGNMHTTHLFRISPLNNMEIVLSAHHDRPYWFYQYPDSDVPELGPCPRGEDEGFQFNTMFDYLYSKDMFFALHRHTGITMIGESYLYPPTQNICIVRSSAFLVVSGNILGVFSYYTEHQDFSWEVHRLDVTRSDLPHWVKVENIGNYAIFMDSDGVFMLKANELVNIKPNCIYCLYRKFGPDTPMSSYEVVRVDIQTGVRKHCSSPLTFSDELSWFVPYLRHLRAQ